MTNAATSRTQVRRAASTAAVMLVIFWAPSTPEVSVQTPATVEVASARLATAPSHPSHAPVLATDAQHGVLAVAPAASLAAFPAVEPVAGHNGAEIARGELIVAPLPGREADVETALRLDHTVLAVERLVSAGLLHVRLDDSVALATALPAIRALDGVADVTTNAILRGSGHGRATEGTPSSLLWNVRAMNLPSDSHERRGQGRAHRDGRANLVVALLDSGAAYRDHVDADGRAHPASPGLASVEIVAPYDALDGDETPDDANGHGTFIANLLVGSPGLGPDAALMPVRVLDNNLVGTEAALIEGMAHASLEGADVINLSLVFDAAYQPTRLLDAAFAQTLASGAVIVAAAGNDGAAQVHYPAAFPGVVAVGASTLGRHGLERASYSSYGAALDFLAPGGDLTTDVNRDGTPDGILAESFDPQAPDHFGLWLYAGTSQAAAQGSAAALYLLADGVEPANIPAQLRESAQGGRFHVETGGGFLDVRQALARHVELPRVGVQTFAVLVEQGGVHGVVAPVALLDVDDRPVAGARVYGRFHGSIETATTCTTTRDGTCTLEASPLRAGAALVALEIEAVVLRDGHAVRPTTVTTSVAQADALAAVVGTGFGSSSTVWSINLRLFSFYGGYTTFMVYGSGEGSALPPTVVAFDTRSADTLLASSSTDGASLVFVEWRPESYLGTALTNGGGFGSSSTVWSSWNFSLSGWGSSVYTFMGATQDRMEAP